MPDERQYLMEYREYPGGPPVTVVCSDLRPVGDDAFLVTYEGGRHLMNLSLVVSLADRNTGEVVDLKSNIAWRPEISAIDIQKIRQRDKSEWDKKYWLRVIENHFRNKLFALFDYRCFKCSKPGVIRTDFAGMENVPYWRGLERDHHVPINLGGRLKPGNIGILCASCNSRKHERPPKLFYTATELERVQDYLNQEEQILAFDFDSDAWRQDRTSYLTRVGIAPDLVREVLTNENHRYYAPPPLTSQAGFGITVDMKEILSELEKQTTTSAGEPEK